MSIGKFVVSVVLLLFIFTEVHSQADSLVFVSAQWESSKISKDVIWKRYHFKNNLFNSNQYINILEVQNKKRTFDFGYDKKLLKLTSEFGKETNSLAAINATFFDIKNGGSVDFLKVEGNVINKNRLRNDSSRAVHQKAAIILDKGRMMIAKWNNEREWELNLPEKDIMLSGPLLVFKQKDEAIDSSSFSYTRHPRSAIVTTSKGRVLLITVDGRNENSAGMSLFELQKILRWLRACEGLNLDGGGSTTLWIHNQPYNGVVNYPSDNKLWDHLGERKVANVIVVKKRRHN
jgi:exopolysaccharide biosynthesis protein